MSEATKIEWCDSTWSPWWGCSKVSEGCRNCYAEPLARRFGTAWGPSAQRRFFPDAHWQKPLRWNRKAEREGVRRRVFCGSMCDVFEDRPELVEPRRRLFALIGETGSLDWLLLTKRPENIQRMADEIFGTPFLIHDPAAGSRQERWTTWKEIGAGLDRLLSNVWLGVSVENQEMADRRIPELLKVPAAVRFLSVEPLLGPVDLRKVGSTTRGDDHDVLFGWRTDYQYKARNSSECCIGVHSQSGPRIDWVIVGGESGPKARPFLLEWAELLRDQCRAAGVPFFLKQIGAAPRRLTGLGVAEVLIPNDSKGGNPDEWPEDLRVREFPA